jgi:hypothetical protein
MEHSGSRGVLNRRVQPLLEFDGMFPPRTLHREEMEEYANMTMQVFRSRTFDL